MTQTVNDHAQIEAFPTLNRVKLIGRGADWEIYTDSNVPLRQLWGAETFAQLAGDLLNDASVS